MCQLVRNYIKQLTGSILNQVKADRRVVVHCALGSGRSVFVMAALLTKPRKDAILHTVLVQIKETRQSAKLNKRVYFLRHLIKRHLQGDLLIKNKAVLIANPVSGTKLWQLKEKANNRKVK